MPKEFVHAERSIARAIKEGKIPKYYYDKQGVRHKSNPYALARKATGYYGTTHDIGMIHPLRHAPIHHSSTSPTHHSKHYSGFSPKSLQREKTNPLLLKEVKYPMLKAWR